MTSTLHHRDEHEDQAAPVDPVMARLAFDAAVDQLTVPGSATITRDDGSTEAAATACLIDQLVDATQPGGERSGSSNPGSRPPASMNALAVVAEIGTEMRDALAALGYNVFGPRLRRARLSTQVRQWASHAEQWQHHDVTYLAYCADQAARWVEQARAVLEPQPHYRLRGHACPVCRETTILVWSDVETEWVRQPALTIDTDRVDAVCGACGTRWGLDVWAQLGTILDNQRKETLALDCE